MKVFKHLQLISQETCFYSIIGKKANARKFLHSSSNEDPRTEK